MDAIEKPKGTYDEPPTGQLPVKCPNCGTHLTQFLCQPGEEHLPDNGSVKEDKIVLSLPRTETKKSVFKKPASKPGSVEADALVVPLSKKKEKKEKPCPSMPAQAPPPPKLIMDTERIRTKQAGLPTVRTTTLPPTIHSKAGNLGIMDHPAIGGQITICVLLFGNYYPLHRRCLNSIAQTVPPSRVSLRIALNQVPLDTTNHVKLIPNRRIYPDSRKRRKVEAMHTMFHDPKCPIKTKWVVWFDDESFVRHPKWLQILCETITNQQPDENVALIGSKMQYHLKSRKLRDPRDWFVNSEWYTGVPFRNKLGTDSPNGDRIHYVDSNFFAIRKDAIGQCLVPDQRLGQGGSAICIGEQLHQGGFKTKHFNAEQKFIQIAAQGKRGYRDKYPWA